MLVVAEAQEHRPVVLDLRHEERVRAVRRTAGPAAGYQRDAVVAGQRDVRQRAAALSGARNAAADAGAVEGHAEGQRRLGEAGVEARQRGGGGGRAAVPQLQPGARSPARAAAGGTVPRSLRGGHADAVVGGHDVAARDADPGICREPCPASVVEEMHSGNGSASAAAQVMRGDRLLVPGCSGSVSGWPWWSVVVTLVRQDGAAVCGVGVLGLRRSAARMTSSKISMSPGRSIRNVPASVACGGAGRQAAVAVAPGVEVDAVEHGVQRPRVLHAHEDGLGAGRQLPRHRVAGHARPAAGRARCT